MLNSYFIHTLLVLFTLSNVISCALPEDETKTTDIGSQQSAINPPTLLLKNLAPIKLISPSNGEAYYIDEKEQTSLNFKYDSSAPIYSSLFLFSEQPATLDNVITNGKETCLGGVTNMTTLHAGWTPTKVELTADESTTDFFTCNNNSTTDAFTVDNKLVMDETSFPKDSTLYWAILGYDAKFKLSHASVIRKVNIK